MMKNFQKLKKFYSFLDFFPDFNLAKGKRTLQSDTLWSYSPELAVDGNPDTCSFTPRGPDSRWWQVHLGHKFNVMSVGVTISPGIYY